MIDAIRDVIITGLQGATVGPYNYTYPNINNHIPSTWTASSPVLWLDNTDETHQEEGEAVGYYEQDAQFNFKVRMPLNSDIALELDNAYDDIKRLIEAQLSNLQAVGMLEYRFIGAQKIYRKNKYYPGEIDIQLQTRYRQLRSNP